MPEFSFFEPDVWTDKQAEIYEDTFPNPTLSSDPVVEALFFHGYMDMEIDTPERNAAREALYEYLNDEYGVDFDEVFDWEEWREQYTKGNI